MEPRSHTPMCNTQTFHTLYKACHTLPESLYRHSTGCAVCCHANKCWMHKICVASFPQFTLCVCVWCYNWHHETFYYVILEIKKSHEKKYWFFFHSPNCGIEWKMTLLHCSWERNGCLCTLILLHYYSEHNNVTKIKTSESNTIETSSYQSQSTFQLSQNWKIISFVSFESLYLLY